MKPIYIEDYCSKNPNIPYEIMFLQISRLKWEKRREARQEYFMSESYIEYTYGLGEFAKTYKSNPFNNYVQDLMNLLNHEFDQRYNVCFLNKYISQFNWLGWHSDDSMDSIAVVSFGAEREIWWKHKDFKGNVPDENKQLLKSGSLFIMPAGFQEDHLHKIPKNSKPCEERISLTFRKMDYNK